jgi:hypothetical protein
MNKAFQKAFQLGVVALVIGAAGVVRAEMSKEVVWPADKITYKEVIPGISKATLWQTPTGAYGAFTRCSPNTQNALHTHSHDLKMVIISGTWNYGTDSGLSKLGAGSYLVIPGGRKHTSGCGADGALFFEQSDAAFDMTPAK